MGAGVLPACAGKEVGPSEPDPDENTVIEAPLRVPRGGFGEEEALCLSDPAANSRDGKVYNRFLWCKRPVIPIEVLVDGVPVTDGYVSGEMVAYGRDDGTRNVTVLFRGLNVEYLGRTGMVTPESIFITSVSCADVPLPSGPFTPSACSVGGVPRANSLLWWSTNRDWVRWTVSSDEKMSTAADKVSRHSFHFSFEVVSNGEPSTIANDADHTIRCDSATYFRGRPKACIFDDALPHLHYSVNDPRHAEVAQHIRQAFEHASSTWPNFGTPKAIPGMFTGDRNSPGLHRITYKGPVWAANQLEKNRACRNQEKYAPMAGLPPTLYNSSVQDCDEFPFASTAEGASTLAFSVLGVNRSQNRCAGNGLKTFYGADRILRDTDTFWVAITDEPYVGTGACTLPADDEPSDDTEDGSGGLGLPDGSPIVSAGPDLTVDEGEGVVLQGSAGDDNSVVVSWSYAPLGTVAAGTTCAFSDGDTTTPVFRCNDDGTFLVTITVDDGVNPSVSDSATITVRNAPPVLTLTGPQPWQLFRVGSRVPLEASFTDGGGNDGHGCSVDWDDGVAESYGASSASCDRTHTFTRAGMFTLRVTVSDDDGASDSESVMVVVYDPAGGFGNADGSVRSGPGFLTTNPGASGEQWFHLTARYNRPGDTVPLGTAKAWLTGTDFRFDAGSAGLDWLVVTPDGKIAAKGSGTIQGNPERYGFVFYGYDGCAGQSTGCQLGPDKFRVVVWPLVAGANPGNANVYDNRAGASYDIDASEPQDLLSGIVTIQPPS